MAHSMKDIDKDYFQNTNLTSQEKLKIENELQQKQFKITNGNTLNIKYVDKFINGNSGTKKFDQLPKEV